MRRDDLEELVGIALVAVAIVAAVAGVAWCLLDLASR